MLLWTGQSVSELGSAVTIVALPLTAVVLLRASTLQVGLLAAAGTLPFLLIALPAGLIVDRTAKRRLMIYCDLARMLIIGSIPAAYALGVLSIAQLYAAALLAGVLTVFFDVAYQSYVPGLIGREQLVDGNGKLGATQSFAQVAGPGLGGALFGFLRAGAMSADAVSYGVSSASMLLIRAREPERTTAAAGQVTRLRTELLAGLAFVAGNPILRKVAACTGTANLFSAMTFAVEIIFMVRVLHVRPAYTGLLIAIGSIGGVIGGIVSGSLARWIGSARIIWVSMLVFSAPTVLLPLAEPGWRIVLIPAGLFGFAFASVLYNIAQLSFRQSICPPHLLGRMNAAIRWIVWGTLPLGSLLGGVLGSALGVRPTIWIGVIGAWASGLWVLFSPLRGMRDIPAPAAESSSGPPGAIPPAARPGTPPATTAAPGASPQASGRGAEADSDPAPILDAHQHVWDLASRDQPFLASSPELAPLRRTFAFSDLRPLAEAAGVTATVLVQTVTEPGETPELLALAAAEPLIAAVIGWTDLTDPGAATALAALAALPGGGYLAGIRHPVMLDPDDAWLTRPEVLRGLAAVAAAGLAFDLVVAPFQLAAAARAAAAVPGLTFVLDHLGNADVGPQVDQQWAAAVRQLAAQPNTACKLSGILSVPAPGLPGAAGGGRGSTAAADPGSRNLVAHLRPYLDVALEAFGPDRMMFGSDWPVCTVSASYGHVISAARTLVTGLSRADQDAILGDTARRIYQTAGRPWSSAS